MIIFMGVAGAGKSVQGKMLADALALPWLSTGEFLRMLIAGERRKDMLAGKLLKDEEIIGLVQKIFSMVDTDHEFILDGFPRTESQTDWLLNQVKHKQLSVSAVVQLVASEKTVMERLLGRGRQDDNEAAIAQRFREYHDATRPILDQFRRAGIPVIDINGEKSVKAIHEDIKKALQTIR